ncbi:MAG: hypothetical protein OSB60_15435, partial [Myxococcota bacterium]|nr:hypothetical protein [Myxococcota bacterium]
MAAPILPSLVSCVAADFLQCLPTGNGLVLGQGAAALGLSNLCIEVDGEPWTRNWNQDRRGVSAGGNG